MNKRNFLSLLLVLGMTTSCSQAMRFLSPNDLNFVNATFVRNYSCQTGADPDPTNMRPLTRAEIIQIVTDLVSERFSGAELGDIMTALQAPFNTLPMNNPNPVTEMEHSFGQSKMDGLFNVVATFTEEVTRTQARSDTFTGCPAQGSQCMQTFFFRYLRKVQRYRPDPSEVTGYLGYSQVVSLREALLIPLLQPSFAFATDFQGTFIKPNVLARDDEAVVVAANLAIRDSYPTEAQYALLDSGFQANWDAIAQLIVSDQNAHTNFISLVEEWSGARAIPQEFNSNDPAFTTIRGSYVSYTGATFLRGAAQEIRDLADYHYGTGAFEELYTTNLSFAKDFRLAQVYGVPQWIAGQSPPQFPPGQERGFVGRAAWLVDGSQGYNNIPGRGLRAYVAQSCGEVEDPDPSTVPGNFRSAPAFNPQLTNAQRTHQKFNAYPVCASCHNPFNYIAFALEEFDNIGRYRTDEPVFAPGTGIITHTLPVDPSVMAFYETGKPYVVSGPGGLSRGLVDTGIVQKCFAKRTFQKMYGRDGNEFGSSDGCAMEGIRSSLDDEAVTLQEVFQRAVQDNFFRKRTVQF